MTPRFRLEDHRLFDGPRPLLAGPADELSAMAEDLNARAHAIAGDGELRAHLRRLIAATRGCSFAPLLFPWTEAEATAAAEAERHLERKTAELAKAFAQADLFNAR